MDLIGKQITYTSYNRVSVKENDRLEKLKKESFKKMKKFQTPGFVYTGKIEDISHAGDGVSVHPCLVISNSVLVDKTERKKLLNKSEAKMALNYCFFTDVIKIH